MLQPLEGEEPLLPGAGPLGLEEAERGEPVLEVEEEEEEELREERTELG